MTREEHLKWCKERALAYVNISPMEAFTSMASDLDKHDETKDHAGVKLGLMLMMSGRLNERDEVIKFIEGFN